MARFCVVVIALCCLVTGCYGDVVSKSAVTRKCSVERSGVLTMFNGKKSTVAVPCRYRLAKIQCGEYKLRVTPGSQLDSSNTFSPYRLFVRIQKTGVARYAWVRTTSRRLQSVAEGSVENPWYVKKGNLSSFDLDLAGFDSAKQADVLRKDGVFEVEFSADQARVVVRCFSDSFSPRHSPTRFVVRINIVVSSVRLARVTITTIKKTPFGHCYGSKGPTMTHRCHMPREDIGPSVQ